MGEHVSKIQSYLRELDQSVIDSGELGARRYGPSTAAAVLRYKRKRHIVNPSYQSQPDDIVGRMTIAALDREMLAKEGGGRGVVPVPPPHPHVDPPKPGPT